MTHIGAITPWLLLEYRTTLLETKAIATVRQHLAIIRNVFDWFVQHGILDESPARMIRGPSKAAENATILTTTLMADAIQRFVEAITGERLKDYRDRPLIALVLLGLKPSSIIALDLSDIRHEGHETFLEVPSFTGGRLLLPRFVAENIEVYREIGGLVTTQSGPIFRTIRGKKSLLNKSAMSRQDLSRVINRRSIEAGYSPTSIQALRAIVLAETPR